MRASLAKYTLRTSTSDPHQHGSGRLSGGVRDHLRIELNLTLVHVQRAAQLSIGLKIDDHPDALLLECQVDGARSRAAN